MRNYLHLLPGYLPIFPSLWWVQGCKNPEQVHPSPQDHLFSPHVPFPSHSHRGHVDDHHMVPPHPIWLPLPKRGTEEHKNAAVYFYCSPFSFSSICLPYGYATLLSSCTHRPFIMRTASVTIINN